MASITYTNLWQKREATFDPDKEGVYAVQIKPALCVEGGYLPRPDLGDGRFTSLAFGYRGNPYDREDQARRAFALLVGRDPYLEDKLELVKVPCIFADRRGQVLVTDTPDPELVGMVRSQSSFHWEFGGVARDFIATGKLR